MEWVLSYRQALLLMLPTPGEVLSVRCRSNRSNPRRQHGDAYAACSSSRYVVDVTEVPRRSSRRSTERRPLREDREGARGSAVDAVIIASPTITHVDLIVAAARQESDLLREADRSRYGARRSRDRGGRARRRPVLRRLQPSLRSELRRAQSTQSDAGAIGNVETVTITSRDPAPPPSEYVQASPAESSAT